MAKTVGQVIAEALAKATHCSQCDNEFLDENDKIAPDEYGVYMSGNADDIICQNCQDRAVDSYLDNYNS
jgi:cytochrome c-type biogenesis protein CcmH/NrfF